MIQIYDIRAQMEAIVGRLKTNSNVLKIMDGFADTRDSKWNSQLRRIILAFAKTQIETSETLQNEFIKLVSLLEELGKQNPTYK